MVNMDSSPGLNVVLDSFSFTCAYRLVTKVFVMVHIVDLTGSKVT